MTFKIWIVWFGRVAKGVKSTTAQISLDPKIALIPLPNSTCPSLASYLVQDDVPLIIASI